MIWLYVWISQMWVTLKSLASTSIIDDHNIKPDRKSSIWVTVLNFNTYGSTLGKIFSRHTEIFFLFSQENRIWLFFLDTIQNLFSGKSQKNTANWSCDEWPDKFSHLPSIPQHLENGSELQYFVCVEVLRPSQPNGIMSSAVSLPNHTFTGQA